MRNFLMPIVLAVLSLMIAAPAVDTAQADPYRWCAHYGGRTGGTNCYFITWEQCRATVSGAGGSCAPNPFYDGIPQDGAAPARRAKKRS
jgi:hypothetical protein